MTARFIRGGAVARGTRRRTQAAFAASALFLAAACSGETRSTPARGTEAHSAATKEADAADAGRASSKAAASPRESHIERFANDRFYIEHDGFIAANHPRVVTAAEATFLSDMDEVLGFFLNGKARAYDVRALSYHHVVNDSIGTQAIAVTY